MTAPQFDDLTDIFESMVNWPKRLAHEDPFYRQLFAQVGVTSVVDVACGTGHHAAMFHSWDSVRRVEGADISPAMIARAKAALGEPEGLRWVVRPYEQPIETEIPFDAAVCVGNSLALAADEATARKALGCMVAAVRPGGVIVVQVLNIWSLPDGPIVWQKSVRANLPDGPALVIKGVHRAGRSAFVELLAGTLEGEAKMRSACVHVLGLEQADLEDALRAGGADQIAVLGGYAGQPYDRAASVDLILVARRAT